MTRVEPLESVPGWRTLVRRPRLPAFVRNVVEARALRREADVVGNPLRASLLLQRLPRTVVILLLAEAFALMGMFATPLVTVPLLLLSTVAVAVDVTWAYRSDVARVSRVVELEHAVVDRERAARLRAERAADELRRLATGAMRTAGTPVVLSRQLSLLTPVLADLLATPSSARREHLAAELELGVLAAARELAGLTATSGTGGSRSVLFRRVGRRFEPVHAQGAWAGAPPAFSSTSPAAQGMRLMLRERRVQPWGDPSTGQPRWGAHLPLIAGRRQVGVLSVDRVGGGPLDEEELDALAVLGNLLVAADSATRLVRPPRAALLSPRGRRRRWGPDGRVGALGGVGGRARQTVASTLARLPKDDENRALVSRALADGAWTRRGDAAR